MLGAGLGRFDEALEMMRRKMSVEVEPSVRTLTTAGTLCGLLGRDADAMAFWRRALEINPDHADVYSHLARHALARGDREAAQRSALRALELSPTDAGALTVLAILDLERGDRRGFVEHVRAASPAYFTGAPSLSGADLDMALLAAQALGDAGRIEEKLQLLDAVEESIQTPRASQYLWLAAVHAMRGETDAAMQELIASPPGRVRERADILLRDPRFASLREEPEFRALVARHLEALRIQGKRIEAEDASG